VNLEKQVLFRSCKRISWEDQEISWENQKPKTTDRKENPTESKKKKLHKEVTKKKSKLL
jgi:hypothetical protein